MDLIYAKLVGQIKNHSSALLSDGTFGVMRWRRVILEVNTMGDASKLLTARTGNMGPLYPKHLNSDLTNMIHRAVMSSFSQLMPYKPHFTHFERNSTQLSLHKR